ncbi:hypothetical protein CMK19_07920 [Candidatus Poribacteria bacterium]|jgi:ribosomal 50S subunit-recycling heat shock protein|nr:hypothetical protein [Candidatus Poribacteria bacterium]MEE2909378.1 RNA-binding S4 domain-containing protein [Candidatus Poribacteria bacterium]|tara:strand:+ start:212 stop:469 length:258 start_codon:yes stop_codon:yes gene_type:complete
MRLDKFLQSSRIIKRRPIANEICVRGKVMVNNRLAKASKTVAIGDMITIDFGDRQNRGLKSYKVLEIPTGNVPKSQISGLYQLLE